MPDTIYCGFSQLSCVIKSSKNKKTRVRPKLRPVKDENLSLNLNLSRCSYNGFSTKRSQVDV